MAKSLNSIVWRLNINLRDITTLDKNKKMYYNIKILTGKAIDFKDVDPKMKKKNYS
jgi:hypothetical protein